MHVFFVAFVCDRPPLIKLDVFMFYRYFYDSPLGSIVIVEDGTSITHLFYDVTDGEKRLGLADDGAVDRESPLLRKAARQLREYFSGKRERFELPLAPAGTPFQQEVWQALTEIPYGEIRSYGQIARQIGRPQAARAVGMANNRNPVSIIIPCHRVVGSNGNLVGYASGTDKKAFLLRREGLDIADSRVRFADLCGK